MNGYLEEHHIPGIAVAFVDEGGVWFAEGYGWADLDRRVPMTPDTVSNIASVSKTVTAAAVLQLRDRGLLDLDDDVGLHLPFPVRHPVHPEVPITIRQLLTHTSAIDDGDAYDESYACGDPAVELGAWVRGYLTPGGAHYDAEQSFLPWPPGERHSYSNVGFGLLGYVVEEVSGQSFTEYVRAHLLEPLGMTESGWYLADVEAGRQAVPYAWIEAGDTLGNRLFGERNGEVIHDAGFVPFCRYSFYNLPDGLLRTSVRQLARFLVAHMRGGEIDGARILAEATVAEILSPQTELSRIGDRPYEQGLAWRLRSDGSRPVWGHSSADPGVRTRMLFDPESRIGLIVLANRAARISSLVEQLLKIGAR